MSDTPRERKVRIMAVCQLFHPDAQATGQLLTNLFTRLAERGFEIEVLAGYPATVIDEMRGRKVPSHERVFGLSITRCGARFDFTRNLLLRAAHYALYLLAGSWKLKRGRQHDFVVGTTNPPFTPIWLWCASRILRFRYQLILHDVYPDGLVSLGMLKPGGVLARAWAWANRRAFAQAERIFVLGRDMAELIEARYAVPRQRIHYIPHWTTHSPSQPRAPEETALWRRLGLTDEFVVQYSGNMGLWADMKTLVRAAALLRDEPGIRFLLIGGGRREAEAKRLAEELGCTNITWLPFQPKETLADSLACCHLALISQRRGLEGIAVPCKLYGILASGRPILGMVPDRSEIARVLREEQCGIVLEPDDSESMASEIRRLASRRGEAAEMGERAFSAYRAKYTPDTAADTYAGIWGPGHAPAQPPLEREP